MTHEPLRIAHVCHEANRAYCETIGDTTQPEWERAPEWQRESAIKGVRFHLKQLSAGRRPSPSASHESWLEEKKRDGWKYGPVKDPVKKEHPCFVPYDQLPLEQQMKDYIFAAIVEAFFRTTVPSFVERDEEGFGLYTIKLSALHLGMITGLLLMRMNDPTAHRIHLRILEQYNAQANPQ